MSGFSEASPLRSDWWEAGRGRFLLMVSVAVILCLLSIFGVLPPRWSAGVAAVGVSFLAVGILVAVRLWIVGRIEARSDAFISAVLETESAACVIADTDGKILLANTQANRSFRAAVGERLDRNLRSALANPQAILLRLQARARAQGRAKDKIVTRGQTMQISVQVVGPDCYFWRFDTDAQRPWDDAELPVLRVGRNDVVLNANSAARALFGTVPTSLAPLFPDGLDAPITRAMTADGEARMSVSQLEQDGIVRDLLLTPLDDPGLGTDATSFADLPVPIMRLSPGGDILEANRLAVHLVGDIEPGRTNIEGMMQGLGYPIRDWLAKAAEQDQTPRSEFLRLTRKDKEIFVQVTLSRICRNGQIALIAVLSDATELKTLEAQFVQGQKMQAVGQLAGGVAHDFNNLLTAISGHCDLLLLRHDQNDPNYGDLVQINQNANRAAALVSQLLAFSRKQTLRPEVLDVRDTISDLIHLLNRLVGEKVRLTLSHDPVLKPVRADKRQLEQVLMNLVVNARDAMPEGGEIRIETEVLMLDQPLSRDRATVPPGEYVTVKVIDSGVGIPADKLQKVFEPFYTTKRTGEGTGLGLSTAYGIVKQTGGFIFVDSVPDRGTEFTVLLPVSPAAETPEPDAPEVPDVQGPHQGEGVVLLVEDEAPVRAFATRALRLKGYTVLEADSAEAALDLLEDPNLSVDVFVTDVVMPGMDGPTWVRQAMQTRPDVRVVFMSGYTDGAFGESGPEVEHAAFLPKPFSLTQLTEAVYQQLG